MKFALLLFVATLSEGLSQSYSEVAHLNDGSILDLYPVCRRNALQAIGDYGNPNGEHYCRQLSAEHQHLFAVELTRCHLHTTGDEVFDGPCEGVCMDRLTERAFASYTQFKIYIEQFCIKTNHDLMLEKQQAMDAQLQQTAHQLSSSFNHLDVNLSNLMTHQNEIKEENSRIFSSFREEQGQLHEKALEQQDAQTKELHNWMQGLMLGQTEEMQMQRRELQGLSTAIGDTAAQLQPLFGLDNILTWISSGVQVSHQLIFLYFTLNVMWLLTIPRCTRNCRRKLWGLAVIESLILCLVLAGKPDDKEQAEFISTTRSLFQILYATIYIIAFISSFFSGPPPSSAETRQQQELILVAQTMQETVQRLDNQLAERERRSHEFEERLVRMLKGHPQHEADRQPGNGMLLSPQHIVPSSSPPTVTPSPRERQASQQPPVALPNPTFDAQSSPLSADEDIDSSEQEEDQADSMSVDQEDNLCATENKRKRVGGENDVVDEMEPPTKKQHLPTTY